MAAKPADAKVAANAASVIADAVKVDKSKLEHVTAPSDNTTVTALKTQNAIKKKDKSTMKHVDAPAGGLTEAQKKAFKEESDAKKAAAKK